MLFREDKTARLDAETIRRSVGWYRWTHDLVEVTGKDALEILEKIFVSRISKVDTGRTKYTVMLNEDGEIIDDVIVMHMRDDLFWVSDLYGPRLIKWIEAHAEGKDVQTRLITYDWDMYAIQGPDSPAAMEKLLDRPLDGLKRFAVAENTVSGIPRFPESVRADIEVTDVAVLRCGECVINQISELIEPGNAAALRHQCFQVHRAATECLCHFHDIVFRGRGCVLPGQEMIAPDEQRAVLGLGTAQKKKGEEEEKQTKKPGTRFHAPHLPAPDALLCRSGCSLMAWFCQPSISPLISRVTACSACLTVSVLILARLPERCSGTA